MSLRSVLILATFALLSIGTAQAAEHEVKMLNKGERGVMVFEPAVLQVAPGDTVHFVPTDKSHNAESIEGMLPEGAQPFAGKINEAVTVTFTQDGVYGIKCKPHYAMGMVALVVVGDPKVNLEAARAVPQKGKAKKVFEELFGELGN
jgi:pseudoazurin